MHHLFNIVTNTVDIPHAILIRAIRPEMGIDLMLQRRNKNAMNPTLTSGPGTVCQALGINLSHDGVILNGKEIWLEDREVAIPDNHIQATSRIGVGYAEEDALLPWRFVYNP
jgi:DNA-3-methyladenine glycosylase